MDSLTKAFSRSPDSSSVKYSLSVGSRLGIPGFLISKFHIVFAF